MPLIEAYIEIHIEFAGTGGQGSFALPLKFYMLHTLCFISTTYKHQCFRLVDFLEILSTNLDQSMHQYSAVQNK